MKRLVFATLATAIASASYAQSAAEPGPSWTGFYLGANAGVLSGDGGTIARTPVTYVLTGSSVPAVPVISVGGTFTQAVGLFGALGNGKTKGMTALMGGGQLGYNHQTGAIVWSAETDIQAVSSSTTGITTREHYNYFGTVRGRVGYLVMPNLLVFTTGGLAYAERQDTITVWDGAAYGVLSRSSMKTGYTVGGGIEYALDQNWSVKGEGLYYDLGTSRNSGVMIGSGGAGGLFPLVTTVRSTSQDRGVIGRVGLNYRFSGW